MTGRIQQQVTVDGVTCRLDFSIVTDAAGPRVDKTGDNVLPAAKTGQLTTRTDNDTGTLSMAGGHGILDGDRLDVYWSGGHRRGMTVGTVAGNSVPVDGGAGDNLPTNLTSITAAVPSEEEFLATGDSLGLIFAKASRRSLVVFADDADAELFAIVGELGGSTGGAYQWRDPAEEPVASDGGVDNPLAGDDVAKVFISNGDSAGTAAVQTGVGYS